MNHNRKYQKRERFKMKREEKRKEFMIDYYEILKSIIDENKKENYFHKKFLEIKYLESENNIYFYFNEEYSKREFKIEYSEDEKIKIYEYDSEESRDYYLIFSISMINYESNYQNLFNLILHFINDLLDIYEIELIDNIKI